MTEIMDWETGVVTGGNCPSGIVAWVRVITGALWVQPPPVKKHNNLTHYILVDFSTVICWTSPFVILGMSGLFCNFYSIFDGISC